MDVQVNFTPVKYAQGSTLQKSNVIKYWSEFKNFINITDEMNVVDVGSGDGYSTSLQLAPEFPNFLNVIGLDISKPMITYSNANYGSAKIKFEHCDIAAPIPKHLVNCCDLVFSGNTLHWLFQQRRVVLQNINKMLRPGGQFFAYFLSTNPLYKIAYEISKMNKYRNVLKCGNSDTLKFLNDHQFNVDEYKNILEEEGFDVTICQLKDNSTTFKTIEEIMNIYQNFDFLNIPEAMEQEFRMDQFSIFKELGYVTQESKNSEIVVSYNHLIVLATKK